MGLVVGVLVVCGNISHLRAGVGVGVTIGPCLGIITGLYSGVITGAGVKMAGFFLQYLNQFIDLNDKACRSNNRSDCGKSKLLNRVEAKISKTITSCTFLFYTSFVLAKSVFFEIVHYSSNYYGARTG